MPPTGPVIASLTHKTEAIRVAALARLLARCTDLSEHETTLITGMSMAVVSKLLHSVVGKVRETTTTNRAKALAYARMLDELFDLNLTDSIVDIHDA